MVVVNDSSISNVLLGRLQWQTVGITQSRLIASGAVNIYSQQFKSTLLWRPQDASQFLNFLLHNQPYRHLAKLFVDIAAFIWKLASRSQYQ